MKKTVLIIILSCLIVRTGFAQDITVNFSSPLERNQYLLGMSSVTLAVTNLTNLDRQISPLANWGYIASIPGLNKDIFFPNGQGGYGMSHFGHYLDKNSTVSFKINLNLSRLMSEIYKKDSSVIINGIKGIKIKAKIIDWSNWREYYSSEYIIDIAPLNEADLSAFQFIMSKGINPFSLAEEGYLQLKEDDITNLALIQQHPQSTFAVLAKLALADQKAWNASWSPDPVLKQQILQWLEQPLNSPFSHIRHLAEETKSKIKT